jgi:hypothetical protein
MTDISTIAENALRRLDLRRPKIPTLGIGASLAAIPRLLGDAFKMAYVDPYTNHGRRPQIVPDDDLKGRDPSW